MDTPYIGQYHHRLQAAKSRKIDADQWQTGGKQSVVILTFFAHRKTQYILSYCF